MLEYQGLLLEFLLLLFELALEPEEPELGFYPGEDFASVKGLCDVVDAADLECPHLVRDVVKRADEDDRYRLRCLVLLELQADVVAVQLGHLDVQHDQLRRIEGDHCKCATTRVRGTDLKSPILQNAGQDREIVRVVVDDEDVATVHLRHVGELYVEGEEKWGKE